MRNTSIKEYIGARYVPLFYEDGQGGAEWNINDDYEPLTIVTHEGNSYTSRQYVPSGIQITNTDYWLETGNWNSQVESYRREVLDFSDRIADAQAAATAAGTAAANAQTSADNAQTSANTANAEITTVEKRGIFAGKLITVGDSYAAGWTPDGNNTGWGRVLAQISGATGHIDACYGGCGFVHVHEGRTFFTLLRDAINSIPAAERADYTAVVIGGGFNDMNISPAEATSPIHSCAEYVRDNLPNAQLVIAFIAWSRYPDTVGAVNRRSTMQAYAQAIIGTRCRFITDTYMALAVQEQTRLASDGRHPTQSGQDAIAQHIYSVCQGGNVEYYSGDTQAFTGSLNCCIKDKSLEFLKFGSNWYEVDNPQPGYNGVTKNGELHFDNAIPFYPPTSKAVYNGVTFACCISYQREGNFIFLIGAVTLRIVSNTQMDIYIQQPNQEGTGWLDNTYTVGQILWPMGAVRFPIIDL